jgi:hypothetical protein
MLPIFFLWPEILEAHLFAVFFIGAKLDNQTNLLIKDHLPERINCVYSWSHGSNKCLFAYWPNEG